MKLVDRDKLIEELVEGKYRLGLIWGSKYANINTIDDAIETVEYADEIDLEEHDRQIRTDERIKTIDEFVKSLFANDVIDKSVVRRVAEQMKEQKGHYRKN